MRARLCVAAGSSTSATMSSSSSYSRAATGRGRRAPRGRGLCDQPRSQDGRWSGGAFECGDAHLGAVTEENYGGQAGCGGDAGAPGAVTGQPPDPRFRFRQPHPRPRQPPPPFYRPPLLQYPWQPPPPGFGPQQHPVCGLRPPDFVPQQHPVCRPPPPRNPWQGPPRVLRPPPPQPGPRPRPADYRSWVRSSLQPPPLECERFRVLSYNILADYLARDHQGKLYFHIPPELLDWEWRKGRILMEFGLWSPDIMCLQEVDKFQDLEQELAQYGYDAVWKMRTGNAVDGCAIFWRRDRFVLRHEEHIEFAKLGLRDNVAQICVLESRSQSRADNDPKAFSARSNSSLRTDRVVVCNIHVLYNPKRGEIKLGQVRMLLDRAYSVAKIWNDAPVIICGDFNCTPKSPLYNFISTQKLCLSGLARNEVSGQYSARIYPPRPSTGSGLYRAHPPSDNNDVKSAVKLDNHQTGIEDQHTIQNNVENASFVDKFSSFHVSEKLSTYGQLKDEERAKFVATSGVEVDGFGSLRLNKERDASEVVKDVIEPSKVVTYMESEGADNLTSTDASPWENLHAVVDLQHDDKYVEGSSFIMETSNKHDEQMNNEHLVTPGSKGMLSGPFGSSSEVKHISTIHNTCKLSTMQEDFIVLENSLGSKSGILPPFEGNKDGLSPENDLENGLDSKSGPDKFPGDVILDISTHRRISKTITVSVGAPSQESIEPSTVFVSGQGKADIDVSCWNSYKSKSLGSYNSSDTHLNVEVVDSSVKEVEEVMKGASCSGDHVVANAHKKMPSVSEDIDSQNIIYSKSSTKYFEDDALSSGVGINASEMKSCLVDEEEDNSDSSFLEELHGTGNVPAIRGGISVTSLSSQPVSLSFPDLYAGQSVGEEEVESDRLDSNISPRPQESSEVQQVYDPFLWTPMEIEAASGSAECTLLEHKLNLRSAYTEVEDYWGTRDSSREPQVTSYNRQFMGTVDYIWHSEELQTIQVLDTIPKHILRRTSGFPTKKWGSDHLALACEFAFKKA